MAEHDIADAIVTRRFDLTDGRHVDIYIWRPVEDIAPEGSAFRCDCQIVGLGDEEAKAIFGVDAVQALTLALQWLGTILYDSPAFAAGDLTFFGDRELGLPTIGTSKQGDIHGSARLLSPPYNYAVVQLPERRFPGIVFQGDSVSGWLLELEEVEASLAEADLDMANETLRDMHRRLSGLLKGYEAICHREGLGLPYVKSAS